MNRRKALLMLGICCGLALGASALFDSVPAFAKTLAFHVTLSGKSEPRATDSAGKGYGTASLDLDTHLLTWNIIFSNLSGPATGAAFYGPAQPGTPGDLVISIKAKDGLVSSPISGSFQLSDEQVEALNGGLIYLDIRTDAFPTGEIRGQVFKASLTKGNPPKPPNQNQPAPALSPVPPPQTTSPQTISPQVAPSSATP